MIKNTVEKIKRNWFQLFVIFLLILCYVRLGEIQESTAFTADIVDESATRMIRSTEDYLNDIERNTENTWVILDDM